MASKWKALAKRYPEVIDLKFRAVVDTLRHKFVDCSAPEVIIQIDKLKAQKATIEESLSEVNAELAAHERLLVDIIEAQQWETVPKFEGIKGSTVINHRPYFKITDPQKYEEWLNAPEQRQLLTLNAQTRDGICRTALEEDQPIIPGVEVSYVHKSISRRTK